MATLTKNWSADVNNVVAGGDEQQQYREAFFAWKEAHKSAGWTVLGSSDGTSVDTTGADLISTPADVTIGTEGSEAHSWIILQAPSAFYDRNPSNDPAVICWACDESSALSAPDDALLRVYDAPAGVDLASGSVTSSPDANGGTSFQVDETVALRDNTAGTGFVFSTVWSDEGDVFFIGKEQGVSDLTNAFVTRVDDASNSGGDPSYLIGFFTGTDYGNVENGTRWTSFAQDGSNATTNELRVISVGSPLNWVNGQDDNGRTLRTPAFLFESGSFRSRYYGEWRDVFTCPTNTPFGTVEDGDTDPFRFLAFAKLWIPWPSSGFPLL